jgi:hypothetical protein
MSAALSRRILGDLLKDYGKYTQRNVNDQVNALIKDTNYPKRVKDNLHYLREIANFSAHTLKEVGTGEIIEVTRDDANWCLDMIDLLFDCFIIEPAKDQRIHQAWDAKIASAGRDSIKRLLQDDQL